jgi:hypothetical protein
MDPQHSMNTLDNIPTSFGIAFIEIPLFMKATVCRRTASMPQKWNRTREAPSECLPRAPYCTKLLHALCLSRWSRCTVKSVWISMEWCRWITKSDPLTSCRMHHLRCIKVNSKHEVLLFDIVAIMERASGMNRLEARFTLRKSEA